MGIVLSGMWALSRSVETGFTAFERMNVFQSVGQNNIPQTLEWHAKNLTVWFLPGDTMQEVQKRITSGYSSFQVRTQVLHKSVCKQQFERMFGLIFSSAKPEDDKDGKEKIEELQLLKKYLASAHDADDDAWRKAVDDLCILATLYLEGGYFVGRNVTAMVTPFVFTSDSRDEVAAVLKQPQRKKDSSRTAHKNGNIQSPIIDTDTFLASSQPGHLLLQEAVRHGISILLKKQSSFDEHTPLLSPALSLAYEALASQDNKKSLSQWNLHPLEEVTATTPEKQPAAPMTLLRDIQTHRIHFLFAPKTTTLSNKHNMGTPTTQYNHPSEKPPSSSKNKNRTIPSPAPLLPPNKPRFVFLMGIEGTGHHLYASLLQKSPTTQSLKKMGLFQPALDLQVALYKHKDKSNGLFTAPFGKQGVNGVYLGNKVVERLKRIAKRVVEEEKKGSFMHNNTNINKNTNTNTDNFTNNMAHNNEPLHLSIPLNGYEGEGRGMMSYPSFMGEYRTLQYPNLHSLYALCTKAQVECSHAFLGRNAYEVIKSTTINRPFGEMMVQVRLLTTMLHVLESQLVDYPERLVGCVDYNDINTTGVPWGVEMLGYRTVQQFETNRDKVYKASPQKSDAERKKVVPLEKWGIHIEEFVQRSEKAMASCLRIHEWNQERLRGGDGGDRK